MASVKIDKIMDQLKAASPKDHFVAQMLLLDGSEGLFVILLKFARQKGDTKEMKERQEFSYR